LWSRWSFAPSLLLVTGLELIRGTRVTAAPFHQQYHVSEAVDISVNSIRDSDLVERGLDEVAETSARVGVNR